MALDTSEIVVAAGSLVAAAPPGTAQPPLGTAPPAGYVDLGYIDEDGVTYGDSPDEENVGAWQSADPVKVIVSTITRTFAFNLMQWNPDVLAFAIGGGMVTPAPATPTFVPAKTGRGEYALAMRWDWDGFEAQLWAPRVKVTGDVESVLTRTDVAKFAVTTTAIPSGSEDPWAFTTEHPAFAGGVMALGQAVKLEKDSLTKIPKAS